MSDSDSDSDSDSKAGATNPEPQVINSQNIEKDQAKEVSSNTNNQGNDNLSNSPVNSKTNVLSIVGLILAFFVPLVGLICSIIGLVQATYRYPRSRTLSLYC